MSKGHHYGAIKFTHDFDLGLTAGEIKNLQQTLNASNPDNPSLAVDGVIGKETAHALQTELKKRGLYAGKIDGIIGPATQDAATSYFQQIGLNDKASHEKNTMPNVQNGAQQDVSPVLSAQGEQVRTIAAANGDSTYMMLDKINGKLILVENGKPTYETPALSGKSTADFLPEGGLDKQARLAAKGLDAPDTESITPAGRFTLDRGAFSQDYKGYAFDLKQTTVTDFERMTVSSLAIHPVYLGAERTEHRRERLRSEGGADNHISHGCINIAPSAITFLKTKLRTDANATNADVVDSIPLYVMPQDERLTNVSGLFSKERTHQENGLNPTTMAGLAIPDSTAATAPREQEPSSFVQASVSKPSRIMNNSPI